MFGLLCNIITYDIYISDKCSRQYIILICYYICIFTWFCQRFVIIAACAMLRFKRLRCACTVSDGDHRNPNKQEQLRVRFRFGTLWPMLEIFRKLYLFTGSCRLLRRLFDYARGSTQNGKKNRSRIYDLRVVPTRGN